jgi:hypothetical protein
MQEAGWLLGEPSVETPSSGCSTPGTEAPKKAGPVAARDFSPIQITKDKLIKSSKSDKNVWSLLLLSHASNRSSNLPCSLSMDFIRETSTYAINMDHRRDPIFFRLHAGRSITKGRLYQFLRTLH